jgi:hypothetical protein
MLNSRRSRSLSGEREASIRLLDMTRRLGGGVMRGQQYPNHNAADDCRSGAKGDEDCPEPHRSPVWCKLALLGFTLLFELNPRLHGGNARTSRRDRRA